MYQVICADPPWRIHAPGDPLRSPRSQGRYYQTMPLSEIKALDAGSLAAKNCALFLWTIDTHLPQALDVIEAWGFSFRTIGFTWVKTVPAHRTFMPRSLR